MKIKPFYAASLLFIYSSSAFALAAGEACSSLGSTAHTGSSSGGVSLMCNGSTWVEIVSYDTAGKAHFKKPVEGITPVNNKDIATKEYVDNAVASAGGGGGGAPTYMGLSSATTNGDAGGYRGMSMICNSTYPGSRMMNSMDYLKIAHKIPTDIKRGWVHCVHQETRIARNGDGETLCKNLGAWKYGYYSLTCDNWRSHSVNLVGITFGKDNQGLRSLTPYCHSYKPVHCVKD